jgi:hypothetical protein
MKSGFEARMCPVVSSTSSGLKSQPNAPKRRGLRSILFEYWLALALPGAANQVLMWQSDTNQKAPEDTAPRHALALHTAAKTSNTVIIMVWAREFGQFGLMRFFFRICHRKVDFTFSHEQPAAASQAPAH